MGPSIRALIFDFDGLILDTEVPEFQSWCDIYGEHGCSLVFDDWARSIGTVGAFDPYADLEARFGRPIDREAVRARRRQRNLELLAGEGVRDGVGDYLADAKRLGLRLAVASSSPREWVGGHLERLELLDRFDCLRCADDVARVKPDPALYQAALAGLGVGPAEAIAFEDSPNGILAAKRAGLTCVAIPNALTGRLDLGQADRVLDSLASVPLEQLLREL